MTLYKIPAQDPSQRLFRIFSWGIIILLTGILALSLYDPTELSDSTRRTIGGAAGALVLISIAGAIMLSAKGSMWKLKRAFQFQLSDDKIVQMREGSPTVEMSLTQVESLHEYHGWLIVRGGGPTRQLAIPFEIDGFEELKGKLAAHCAVMRLKTKISILSFVPLVLAVGAYAFLFTSRIVSVVIASGCGALLIQGWGFYSLWRAYRGKSMNLLLMGAYFFTCLVIVWLVYQRTRAIV